MTPSVKHGPSPLLFAYPTSAFFGSVLPKKKIYEKACPSAAVQKLFVGQVEQIVWQYKLSSETVNLPQTPAVPEIELFSIALKNGDLKHEVLRCIDQAIPLPMLFELRYEGRIKAIAAYKRPSGVDRSKWVASDYFETDWLPSSTPRVPLPMALDLEQLYSHLLRALMPFPARAGEGLDARVERMELIRSKQRERQECQARLRKEKQFNRKVEINAELRAITQVLVKLTA